MVAETQETITVPANTAAFSNALATFVSAVIVNQKAGGGAVVEISKDVTAALADLGPAVQAAGLLGADAKADPAGFLQAFLAAGAQVYKGL